MKVGFIGLGTMGASMASNLQKAGHELAVNDVRRDATAPHVAAGAQWKDTPRQVAEGVEVVFTSLPGPAEVEAVAVGKDGLDSRHAPGRGVLRPVDQFASAGAAPLRQLQGEGAVTCSTRRSAAAPRAPSPASWRSGWAGTARCTTGSSRCWTRSATSPTTSVPIGAGSVAKLVHNCAGYAMQTALAEVFTMGVKAGVDPLELWKAVRQGAGGRRRTFDGLVDQFLPGTFDPPAFTLKLAHKDVTLATALARELGVPMRVANLALEEMTEALNRGWGQRDSRVAMLLQEERAGVQIAVPPDKIRKVLEADG